MKLNRGFHCCICLLLIGCASTPQNDRLAAAVEPKSDSEITQPPVTKAKPNVHDILKLGSDSTEASVVAILGPPDAKEGAGVDYWAYKLDEDRQIWFHFVAKPPFLVRGAWIHYRDGVRELRFSRSDALAAANGPTTNQPSKRKEKRNLDDIKLTPDLTTTQVVSAWGPPDSREGSGIDYWAYKLDQDRTVWLTFTLEDPPRLNWALLFYRSGVCVHIFSKTDRPIAASASQPAKGGEKRKLDFMKLAPDLTRAQIAANWGPPDETRSPAVEYWKYKMDDDRELRLAFSTHSPHLLAKASIHFREGGGNTFYSRENNEEPDP